MIDVKKELQRIRTIVYRDEFTATIAEHIDCISGLALERIIELEKKLAKYESANKNITPPNGINTISWNEWIEFRKSKKKPVSQLAANKVFKWLVNYSPQEQQDIVNKSITNDYQGLFEPKVQHENSQRNNSEYVDNSAAGRVRAEVAKLRASRGSVANDVIDVRPQVGIELRHES